MRAKVIQPIVLRVLCWSTATPEALNVVSKTIRISSLNTHQETGIRKIVREERISLLYQALWTLVLISSQKSLVTLSLLCQSPCIRSHLKELGLKAANISSLEDHERTSLENGELIFGILWITWNSMLTKPMNSKQTVCHSSRRSARCKAVESRYRNTRTKQRKMW